MNEQFIHWAGALSQVTRVFSQDLQIDVNTETSEPLGGLHIHAVGWGGSPLYLPNSTNSSPVWSAIPGTSPTLEVRQDGHYPTDIIIVRQSNAFVNMTPVNANIILGAVPASTRREQSGDAARIRGFLQATAGVASGQILANITAVHRPLHAVSMGVRYSGGSNRLQIAVNGDVTLAAALNAGDQVWMDGTTYDLLT